MVSSAALYLIFYHRSCENLNEQSYLNLGVDLVCTRSLCILRDQEIHMLGDTYCRNSEANQTAELICSGELLSDSPHSTTGGGTGLVTV